jgi:uncharacterized protein YciI
MFVSKLYTIINKDKPDSGDIRQNLRPEHLDYLNGLGEQMVLAGPFVNQDGASVGSLIIVRADNLAAAEALAKGDPFVAAGLFASSEVSEWKWSVNAPEGM